MMGTHQNQHSVRLRAPVGEEAVDVLLHVNRHLPPRVLSVRIGHGGKRVRAR